MSEFFNTPVAVFTFNRPELTQRLLDVLSKIKPRRILVVSDGARPDVPGDAEKCHAVRRLFDDLNWECLIEKNYAESNMGSFARNSSGLNWVFENVEEAIILEDDCLPDPSFFPYCAELLEKYRFDPNIGLISGNNFLNLERKSNLPSYFFSSYATTWGWASWRRTWQQVDLSMPYWPAFRDSGELRAAVHSREEVKYWKKIYNAIEKKKMKNAWDYQLMLACFKFNMLTIVPSVNLVSNIGYGPDATHCKNASSPLNDIPRGKLEFPLSHKEKVRANGLTDYKIFSVRFQFKKRSLYIRFRGNLLRVKRILNRIFQSGKKMVVGRP